MNEFNIPEGGNDRGTKELNVPEYPPIHERVWNFIKSVPQKIRVSSESFIRDAGLGIRDAVQGIALWARDRSCEQVDCKEIYKYAGHGGIGNAIDHAIVSAVAARKIHPRFALAIGEAKEALGPLGNRYNGTDDDNQKDSEIDLCNNKIGAQIGQYVRENALGSREITTLMVDALKRGKFALGNDARLQRWNNGNCEPWDGPSLDWENHDLPPYTPRIAPKTAKGK